MPQPLNQRASFVAQPGGTWVATFPPPPQGFEALVSVNMPGAQPEMAFFISVSGLQVGSVPGNNPFGPYYLGPGEELTVESASNGGVAVMSGTTGRVGTIGGSPLLASGGTAGTANTPVNAGQLQGVPIAQVTPSDGQFLVFGDPATPNDWGPAPSVPPVAGQALVWSGTAWEPSTQVVPPWFFEDAGPEDQTLQAGGTGGVTPVPSPAGMGQAAQFSGGNWLYGPTGTTAAQGAITGPFSAEVIWTPSAADLSRSATRVILEGMADGGRVWVIEQYNADIYVYAANTLLGSWASGAAGGVPIWLAICWDGAYFYLFQGGQLKVTTAFTPAGSTGNYLLIGGDGATSGISGSVNEVRLSHSTRYTAAYTPQATPYITDTTTACLYHFGT